MVEQRTRDLEGRMGQLRGFSLDAFLADHAEGEKSFPWSIGDDAIPDKIEETDAVAQMQGCHNQLGCETGMELASD